MHHLFKVTSSIALLAVCSACAENNSSSELSDQNDTSVSSQGPSDQGLSNASEVKAVISGGNLESETRSADSHTHGDASLGVVLEGSTVTVEFETPLYNVLGFEHAAETDAQKAAVSKAESVLSNGASLFVFNREAKCASSSATTSVELNLEHDSHDEKHEDEHHEDEHEDEHHEDEHEDDETHKDITVQYNYKCQSPKALKNITVALFEHFDNLSEIDLVYLGPNTQKQAELSATKPRLDLTR